MEGILLTQSKTLSLSVNRTVLQNCLTAAKQHIDSLFAKDKPVALYFFNPMKAGGCSGHPSVA